jgi:hypothetical protein
MWGMVWFGMWVSLTLAQQRRLDPYAVPFIQLLKRELQEKGGAFDLA